MQFIDILDIAGVFLGSIKHSFILAYDFIGGNSKLSIELTPYLHTFRILGDDFLILRKLETHSIEHISNNKVLLANLNSKLFVTLKFI